jgi:mRNA-degrading endonuclease RelE of RelBE toxin-antitoxin system
VELYEKLPKHIQRLADKYFLLLKADPNHPSLKFKKLGEMWSVRVGAHYRALAFEYDDVILWIWIGSHADYDKMMP